MYSKAWAPWDIGEAQPVIRQLVALGAVTGDVLDVGCGTGWHSIEAARAGCTVTGLDVAPTAVASARRNAQKAGVTVDFVQDDVTQPLPYERRFDTVLDVKLYDNLEDTAARYRYAKSLHQAMTPGAKLFMFGFGPGHVNGVHNHELEEPDFQKVLPAAGFNITYVGTTTYQLLSKGWAPICAACPAQLPGHLMTIPSVEVHATRSQATSPSPVSVATLSAG
jgi:SAM-dependent methyltransferase